MLFVNKVSLKESIDDDFEFNLLVFWLQTGARNIDMSVKNRENLILYTDV
jgi:predicted CoA-binding protein